MLQTNNISALVAEVKRLVSNDRGSKLKQDMQTGIDYYEGKHDIANYRLFYFNNEEEREKLFLDKIEKGIVYVLGIKIDLKTEESRYMGVLVGERERCERLYHDNPKEWEERKYLNRLKKQRQWTESKATMVAEKERKKEERKQEQFNKDIDIFANLYYTQYYT